MTLIREDWEHCLQHEAMYSIEEKMRIEEEYWQWEENEQRLPARIEIIKHPNYDNRRIKTKTF